MFRTKSQSQILLSSSSLYKTGGYLQHVRDPVVNLLQRNKVKTVLFIPYANVSQDYNKYTQKVRDLFAEWGFEVEGIDTYLNPIEAVQNAEAIFIGGGNTFLLLRTLYDLNLVNVLRERILNDNVPYIGSSAGTNVAAFTIHTTNDMPIVYPPSFDALQLVPYHINPHYLDSELSGSHFGETREQRILEFMLVSDRPCLALREGTCLVINGEQAILIGESNARLFIKGQKPIEYPPNTDFGFLFLG